MINWETLLWSYVHDGFAGGCETVYCCRRSLLLFNVFTPWPGILEYACGWRRHTGWAILGLSPFYRMVHHLSVPIYWNTRCLTRSSIIPSIIIYIYIFPCNNVWKIYILYDILMIVHPAHVHWVELMLRQVKVPLQRWDTEIYYRWKFLDGSWIQWKFGWKLAILASGCLW